jgi:hypothetical protein
MESCASRNSSRAARSRIAQSGQSRFHRETVEGCTPTRAAAALSEAPVSRITAHSASSICAFNPLGLPTLEGPEHVEGAGPRPTPSGEAANAGSEAE